MAIVGSTEEVMSDRDWAVVCLPSNKQVLYKTLKAFTLDQNVLYIGETGSGKTWLARVLAQLLGMRLWTISLTEYTKNEDLTVRTTFGEEGSNRTGLSKCSVLQWMEEGGLLLLDELHKPMDGLAVLNNILQYGEFTLPNGSTLKLDPGKCKVIATMNPIRPPYRGELPSAELAARFGATLEVGWLPSVEEVALLAQHAQLTPKPLIERLVWMAAAIRSQYPHSIPVPLSTRTLMHIVTHCNRYPLDSVRDIIQTSFNPCAAIDDLSVREALDKVLTAHGFDAATTTEDFINVEHRKY
jgi:MoxR-like ATPase